MNPHRFVPTIATLWMTAPASAACRVLGIQKAFLEMASEAVSQEAEIARAQIALGIDVLNTLMASAGAR